MLVGGSGGWNGEKLKSSGLKSERFEWRLSSFKLYLSILVSNLSYIKLEIKAKKANISTLFLHDQNL